MAPPPKAFSNRNSANIKKKSDRSVLETYYKKYVNLEFVKSLFIDPNRLPIVSILIILAEIIINVLVINRVPYTEIDWKAYMQECEGFLNGTTNYALLKGDTGPLVYPAGFVYIYSALYFITSRGENVRLAQYVFAGIYILQMFLVLRLYTKSRKVPPFVLILSAFTSYRIHSIYVLRLFNDPIAILFAYMAINLFLDRNWTWGSVCFSLGVSVKMNILLFAPALLVFYITNLGYFKTVIQLAICGTIQLILGAPFLFNYPLEYIKGSFDVGRIFEHKWTVNYRFLDQVFFESKLFHIGLLILHLGLLLLFAPTAFRYLQNYCRLREVQKQFEPQIKKQNLIVKNKKQKSKVAKDKKIPTETISEDQQKFLESFEKSLQKSSGGAIKNQQTKHKNEELIEPKKVEKYSIHFDQSIQLALLPLFLCNFIGVACSRSLHYQFYVWYFHSLPYLTWCTDYGYGLRFLLMGLIEFCWNTYPSTNFSSATLHLCHLVLLYGICRQIFKTKQMSEKVQSE